MKSILSCLILASILTLVLVRPSPGALLYLEDFSSGAAGWSSRDGELSVSPFDNGTDQYLVGNFGNSFLPQTDAFRIASGSDFLGDYTGSGLTQISFDFYAVNVLPSDLMIRIVDGSNAFTYQFNPLPGALLGSWVTFTVDLAWSYGWSGLSEASFNTALTSVDAVEIQVTRSGSGTQQYYLDNVQTLDTDISGGGGPGGVIPEPSTMALFVTAVGVMTVIRRKMGRSHSKMKSIERISVIFLIAGSLLSGMVADAAQPLIEDFGSTSSGWTGQSEFYTGAWDFSGGTADAVFYNTGSFAFPDVGGAMTMSGSFVGDYDAIDAEAIGFSFMAPDALPASGSVELEWEGAGSIYRRAFTVEQVGVWYQFTASLRDADKKQWTVIQGSLDNFAAARQSVERVGLRVARTLTVEHRFTFDNIFIAARPEASVVENQGAVSLKWQGLNPAASYRIERTTNLLANAWTFHEQVSPEGSLHEMAMPADVDNLIYFRMRFE